MFAVAGSSTSSAQKSVQRQTLQHGHQQQLLQVQANQNQSQHAHDKGHAQSVSRQLGQQQQQQIEEDNQQQGLHQQPKADFGAADTGSNARSIGQPQSASGLDDEEYVPALILDLRDAGLLPSVDSSQSFVSGRGGSTKSRNGDAGGTSGARGHGSP